MIGSVIGAFAMVATRRSVIFNAEGLELVFTFWGTASSVSSAQKLAPRTPASPFKNPRRPVLSRMTILQGSSTRDYTASRIRAFSLREAPKSNDAYSDYRLPTSGFRYLVM